MLAVWCAILSGLFFLGGMILGCFITYQMMKKES